MRECGEVALAAARHGARHVAQRCGARPAGQDEFLERRQAGVVVGNGGIQLRQFAFGKWCGGTGGSFVGAGIIVFADCSTKLQATMFES